MRKLLLGLFLCCSLYSTAQFVDTASYTLNLDSVQTIRQTTYIENTKDPKNNPYKSAEKVMHFNEEGIRVEETRRFYTLQKKGQGTYLSSYFHEVYKPTSRLGTRLKTTYPAPQKRSTKDSVTTRTKYESYNHKGKYYWLKQYDANNKLTLESSYRYDKNGALISVRNVETRDGLRTVREDEMKRTSTGDLLTWKSYTTVDGNRELVRDLKSKYTSEGQLLTRKGYVYNDYQYLENQYDKQGQLKKTTAYNGYRRKGKSPTEDYKTLSWYKEGKLTKEKRYHLGKRIAQHTYSYAPNEIVEVLRTKKKEDTFVTRLRKDTSGRVLRKIKLKNDKLEYDLQLKYNIHERVVYRKESRRRTTGALWSVITTFNDQGNPIRRQKFVDDRLIREDKYEYTYYPQPEPEETTTNE